MRKQVRAFPLGGCGVHAPPFVLARLGFYPFTIGQLGFRSAPFAFSAGAVLQAYEFCVGERLLPLDVRRLAYLTENQPTAATRHLVDGSDLAFVELCDTCEPLIGGDVVNYGYVGELVIKPLQAAGVDPVLLRAWQLSLRQALPDLAERSARLLANWPADLPVDDPRRHSVRPKPGSTLGLPMASDPQVRWAVENLRARRLSTPEMEDRLAEVRDRLGAPLALHLFHRGYLASGRAKDLPRGFLAQQREIARRLALPTIDFAPLVRRLGPGRLMIDDPLCGHFREAVHPLVAELMYDFWAEILGRPYLETYPEWLEVRGALRQGLPSTIDGPARRAFPRLWSSPTDRRGRRPSARARKPEDLVLLPLGGRLLHQPLKAWTSARGYDPRIAIGPSRPTPQLRSLGEIGTYLRRLRQPEGLSPEMKALVGLEPGFSALPLGARLESLDVVLLAPETPFQIEFDGYILQRNAVVQNILAPIREAFPDAETLALTGRWLNQWIDRGLESAAPLGETLAGLLPGEGAMADLGRRVLRGAQSRPVDPQTGLENLVNRLERPFGVVLQCDRYSPDGEAQPSHPQFLTRIEEIARARNIPLLAARDLVGEAPSDALLPGGIPYAEAFNLRVGEAFIDFAARIAGL